jgi:hypothetical protein
MKLPVSSRVAVSRIVAFAAVLCFGGILSSTEPQRDPATAELIERIRKVQ